jgi:tRNA threonylcarbamoyladenosine biosynthesis protein TsaE
MTTLVLTSETLADTALIGQALARHLPDSTVVSLTGTLGAGKTRLVQDLAVAVGVPERSVLSPTFVICQTYQAERLIVHIDAYRIHDTDEFESLGLSEHFSSPALTLIEWGERIQGSLPRQFIQLTMTIMADDSRLFTLASRAPRFDPALLGIARDCASIRFPRPAKAPPLS